MQDEYKTENIDDVSVEKQQEMLLMSKLTASGKTPPKTQSSFLAKKLQQRKYFDSGDYAMNQDKEKKQPRPLALAASSIPGSKKPELPPALKKQFEEQPTAAAPSKPLSPIKADPPAGSPSSGDEQEEHLVIPRPDTVPHRKASILHPSAHSKLSPQPLIHHETHDELSPQN